MRWRLRGGSCAPAPCAYMPCSLTCPFSCHRELTCALPLLLLLHLRQLRQHPHYWADWAATATSPAAPFLPTCLPALAAPLLRKPREASQARTRNTLCPAIQALRAAILAKLLWLYPTTWASMGPNAADCNCYIEPGSDRTPGSRACRVGKTLAATCGCGLLPHARLRRMPRRAGRHQQPWEGGASRHAARHAPLRRGASCRRGGTGICR